MPLNQSPIKGRIEVYESQIGGKRIKGKWSRGVVYKITALGGIFKRDSKILHPSRSRLCKSHAIKHYLRGRVDPYSVIHSDSWRGYNGLVDFGYKKHYRVCQRLNEFA